ncbi:outer membrane receptor for ferrienterochelin and colicin [Mesoflavibacter sabulilitoris]|uniref:TonB-dependent receptor n=1 Tax=Mesoflavibacter zeaxanthinifaciens subsp. sabulilitoris TaxID=1520893 RepID=A0A2T1NFF7_9FLAO|nr:TonB-dependent receptor [Mesoflavibacter zeaxanthinifaciens]MBB3124743.1 outer membrane receptor for ferrienterochelin and colicin [Mesoflavibacter zeaxanthinifaciens subsp. sabulilitoris]PSG91160.1 TonB-dependent receptor [Mesoflavibacter zeaxanthinifaciens subsp. sabulilitoris]
MKKLFILLFCFLPLTIFAQNQLKGYVYEANEEQKETPLPGANLVWLNTTVGTSTEFDGSFSLPLSKTSNKLVISYVGFKTDTITVNSSKTIKHWLEPTTSLDEVVLDSKVKSTSRSYIQSENIQYVSSDELLKAACCNLSESFETNPSIDVNFSDAVTGTKQIKMLGLSSPYILIATENIPSVRGASQAYGLSFIPGTWVESIQITKGAGSVVNGYESISGQINAELQKPMTDDKVFVNMYAATSERLELNTHFNTNVSKNISTGLYIHGNTNQEEHDRNDDGFLDMPKFNQINLMNRWQYTNTQKGIVTFLNLKYLDDYKQSGQINFNPDTDKLTTNNWGSEIDTKRYEVSGKFGYVNADLPWQSLGIQMALSNHQQDSYFGLNEYNIEHTSVYSNVIYNSIISDSRHKIKTGVNFTYDNYDEFALNTNYDRVERSFGGFFEYSFDNLKKLNLTAGLRFDTHNLLGEFITPRFHLRYSPWSKSAFRASFGRGKRSANIFAENQNLFASSRQFSNLNNNGPIYGLDPEIAWNYGVSYLQGFNLFGRKADVTFDFYRTDFKNQVVVDLENAQAVSFYNLQGSSYANSFQVEVNYEAFNNFDLRTAYKYYDVKTDYQTGKLSKPLTPKHRFFANAGYKTELKNQSQWKFDATFNWLGEQRFSSTIDNPIQYQLNKFTPTVATLNMQVTKVFSSKFEIYLGGENITNVKQDNPIVSANDPFGTAFDTNFVYGPIFGSMYYTGLRYKLN